MLAVFLAATLWGTTGTAATFAPVVSPIAIGAGAMGIGGLLQATIGAPSIWSSRSQIRPHARLAGIGAFSVAIYPLAFYSSMRFGGVAIGTVVTLASAPIFSGLLELTVDRRPLGARWIVAVALGTMGCAILCLGPGENGVDGSGQFVVSILLGVLAGATYAIYSWSAHRLMVHGVARPAAMGTIFGLGGLLLVPLILATGSELVSSVEAFAVGAYMAVVPMFLGYVLFGIGLARIRPTMATTITLVEPAVATFLAIFVVGERLAATGWIGLALIATTLCVLSLRAAPSRATTSG
jgi:DME family drug/metabolite transporter